jgi:hypothetical protein
LDLVEKIVELHSCLTKADIPHAFGGALALAWCTASARGTLDIAINVLASGNDIHIHRVLDALPDDVSWDKADVKRLQNDLQHRLWWQHTPLDIFFNSTDYHDALETRVRWESFAGEEVPFLSCVDLAVFKVFFDRTKDWADLEAMRDADTLDLDFVAGVVSHYLGADDHRLKRLLSLYQTE